MTEGEGGRSGAGPGREGSGAVNDSCDVVEKQIEPPPRRRLFSDSQMFKFGWLGEMWRVGTEEANTLLYLLRTHTYFVGYITLASRGGPFQRKKVLD